MVYGAVLFLLYCAAVVHGQRTVTALCDGGYDGACIAVVDSAGHWPGARQAQKRVCEIPCAGSPNLSTAQESGYIVATMPPDTPVPTGGLAIAGLGTAGLRLGDTVGRTPGATRHRGEGS